MYDTGGRMPMRPGWSALCSSCNFPPLLTRILFALSVVCGCFGENINPAAADCSALINSLPVIASITGPTFIIQPGTVHTTSLRTCSISFTNLGTTPEEFCWDDLVRNYSSLFHIEICLLPHNVHSVFSRLAKHPEK